MKNINLDHAKHEIINIVLYFIVPNLKQQIHAGTCNSLELSHKSYHIHHHMKWFISPIIARTWQGSRVCHRYVDHAKELYYWDIDMCNAPVYLYCIVYNWWMCLLTIKCKRLVWYLLILIQFEMDTLKKKIYHFIFSWLNKALIDYICNKRNIKEAGERKIEDNPRENITK